MLPDPKILASALTQQTGLLFSAKAGVDQRTGNWIELTPEEHDHTSTFSIRVTFNWRRLQVTFTPGKFAGPMLELMGSADPSGKAVFHSILKDCKRLGGEIELKINGVEFEAESEDIWVREWKTAYLGLRSPNTVLDEVDQQLEASLDWTTRLTAAVVALLPLIEKDGEAAEVDGYPEGAKQSVVVNRYERDPRNRLAAIAIHGHRCLACDMDFGETYGAAAAGFIEVHHLTPVSQLGSKYVIDPARDLVPLCPNCHSVAHKQNPSFTVEELRQLLSGS